jgi:hypothetical protein
MVGAVQREIPQAGELRLDPVQVAGVGRGIANSTLMAAAQSPTRESFLVVRCAEALSSTIPIRTPGGYRLRT